MAKVLLYRLDAETPLGAGVRDILRELGIHTVTVEKNQLHEQVGALAGLPGCALTGAVFEGPPPEMPFLLMCGMGEKQLDSFLKAMRERGVSVAYKAILTPHNRDWTFLALMEEVAREHALLHRT